MTGRGEERLGRPGAATRCKVVIPAYNEAGKIETLLARIPAEWRGAVIVVDDGSTDATPQIVREAGLRLLSTGARHGVGYALRLGIQASLADGAGC